MFINHRKKMRIVSIICAFLAVVLAVCMYFLLEKYKEEDRKRREDILNLSDSLFETVKNPTEDDIPFDVIDKELAEKLENYNFYEKLKEKLQVNALFLGTDSTRGAGVSSQNNNWVILLAEEIEYGYGSNIVGEYAKTNENIFYGYYTLKDNPKELIYDLVVVCYGENEDPQTFELYYDGLLHAIKNQNPKCEIYCIIEATESGVNQNADSIREMCEYYGGICIDMNEYFDENHVDRSEALTKEFIPTNVGCREYYNALSSVIWKNLDGKREIPEISEPRLETSKWFEDYEFFVLDDMKKVSDTVYEFSTNAKIASLITYKSYFGDRVRVYINGRKELTQSNKMEENLVKQIQNSMISYELEGKNKIKIDIGKAGNESNIVGVVLCGG
ncbi:MAG: SGNH/GDSL hydrolase family protein [Clostridia bacterium]|nr:SGNH/GDSL hydrolase family protein [Clostridia bacterium]